MSWRMSTNTGTAPRRANAFAVDTKVNDGMITSSPGPMSDRSADISRAPVQEWVSSARRQPRASSSHAPQRLLNGPLADRWDAATADSM